MRKTPIARSPRVIVDLSLDATSSATRVYIFSIEIAVAGFAQNDEYAQALQAFRDGIRCDESIRAVIQARQSTIAEDELSARLMVLRDVADIVAAEEHWREALGYSHTVL